MHEIYVYSEGGRPFEVFYSRREAVDRALEGDFKVTPEERKKIVQFMEGNVCDLGGGLHLVGMIKEGYKEGDAEAKPDRRITRVIGPGSLV